MPGSNPFAAALEEGRPIILDGGLATELEAQGASLHPTLWSAGLLHSDPEAIISAHLAYIEAGADCIISASYQATRKGFMSLGLSAGDADQLILLSVELAGTARARFLEIHPGLDRKILVAASVGPYGAARQDGSEYVGAYGVTKNELREFHAGRLALLDGSGADLLACETIPDYEEVAVLAGLLRTARTPAWVSFSCRDGTRISDGTPIRKCVELFRGHPAVLAVGVNCTPPQFIPSLIRELKESLPEKAIVVYPNSGERYDAADNTWHDGSQNPSTPQECGLAAQRWLQSGARIVGGCCRMGPAHIRQMRARIGAH